MMWHNGREYKAWTNKRLLSDDRKLVIHYTTARIPASFHHPEEFSTSEIQFYIDGFAISREDLPAEVTDTLIAELEATARENPDYDFGGFD